MGCSKAVELVIFCSMLPDVWNSGLIARWSWTGDRSCYVKTYECTWSKILPSYGWLLDWIRLEIGSSFIKASGAYICLFQMKAMDTLPVDKQNGVLYTELLFTKVRIKRITSVLFTFLYPRLRSRSMIVQLSNFVGVVFSFLLNEYSSLEPSNSNRCRFFFFNKKWCV